MCGRARLSSDVSEIRIAFSIPAMRPLPMSTFAAHASLGFFHGADLADPAGLLEGGGKRMRHVTLSWGPPADGAAFGALIDVAYRDIRHRLVAP